MLSQIYIVLRETGNLLKIWNVICKVSRFGTEHICSKIDFLEILIYRVSTKSFPDYKTYIARKLRGIQTYFFNII